jgi:signal peptide peptidase SppA
MNRFPMPSVGALSMLEPSLVPADAGELIRAAMAAGRKPAARKLTNLAGRAVTASGSSGILSTDGILSVVEIDGYLSQGEDPFAWIFGGCSLGAIAQAYRDAADDPETRAVLVRVNSPGGSCAGNADVQAALAYLLARKPVHAIANDLACSGGYYCIARATEIVALSSSLVGSIGVFVGPYFDVTGMLARDGIEAWFGATGKLKGAGSAGFKVTAEARAHTQRLADDTAADFFAAVAAGRKLSVENVREMEAGCFAGHAALAAKLADRIVPSLHDYAIELQSKYAQAPATAPSAGAPVRSPKPVAQESSIMAEIDWSKVTDDELAKMPAALKAKVAASVHPESEQPATPSQLKAAFPEDAELRGRALDQGWTLTRARDENLRALHDANTRLAAQNKELEATIAGAEKARTAVENKLGGRPGGASAVAPSNADKDANGYEAAIVAKMTANPGMSRGHATGLVNAERPDLRAAYLAARRALQNAR